MNQPLHGGDRFGREEMLDFSANTSMLGLPDGVKAALHATVDSWDTYPDPLCRTLKAAIAAQDKVESGTIYCGNGAADLIFRVVAAIRPRRAVVLTPSFAEYQRALDAVGCEVLVYPLQEKDDFALTTGLLEQLEAGIDLLLLCNPNNPTGRTIAPALLERILEKTARHDIALLLDECFIGFLDCPQEHSQMNQLSRYPNLILLRAFTKFYGMAGLRLGYLVTENKEIHSRLEQAAPPWVVSTPAQIAGVIALEEQEYAIRVQRLTRAGRAQLSAGLIQLGLHVIGGEANFLFFRAAAGLALKEKLLQKKILIRACDNFEGLDDRFYRICVRLPQENEQLLAALEAVLKG